MKTTAVRNQAGAENGALLERIGRQFKDSAELKQRALEVLATPIALATELMVKCLLAKARRGPNQPLEENSEEGHVR